jgi:hypothetical protein
MRFFEGFLEIQGENVPKGHLSKPEEIRFQPFRLEESRCWKGASKRLTCVTCHDPHAPLIQNSAHYDHVCLRCHSRDSKPHVTRERYIKVFDPAVLDAMQKMQATLEELGRGQQLASSFLPIDGKLLKARRGEVAERLNAAVC